MRVGRFKGCLWVSPSASQTVQSPAGRKQRKGLDSFIDATNSVVATSCCGPRHGRSPGAGPGFAPRARPPTTRSGPERCRLDRAQLDQRDQREQPCERHHRSSGDDGVLLGAESRQAGAEADAAHCSAKAPSPWPRLSTTSCRSASRIPALYRPSIRPAGIARRGRMVAGGDHLAISRAPKLPTRSQIRPRGAALDHARARQQSAALEQDENRGPAGAKMPRPALRANGEARPLPEKQPDAHLDQFGCVASPAVGSSTTPAPRPLYTPARLKRCARTISPPTSGIGGNS